MKTLSPRLVRVATRIGGGENTTSAFRAEGFSDSYALKGFRWLKDSRFAAIIDRMQADLMEKKMYDAQSLVDECDRLQQFAIEKGNPMAAVKAVELKARALGLLTEKIEVKAGIDIGAVLAEARTRAAKVINAPELPWKE